MSTTDKPAEDPASKDDSNPFENETQAGAAGGKEGGEQQQEVKYSVSPGLVGWMRTHDLSIGVTSYQSGKFYLLGQDPRTGGLMVHERNFQKAMGLNSPREGTVWLVTQYSIMRFEDVLRENEMANQIYDGCFVPRTLHVTGAIDGHDVGELENGNPVFINTRFNALCTVSPKHSFKVMWTPPFISKIVEEDRCHMNGLAMDGTEPAYVTACSRSDTVDGWRDRRSDGGVVVDIRTNEIVCEGLSMPHSPRLHNGKLYVLNSGTGELGYVDLEKPAAEAFTPVAFVPGFARGLSVIENFALVGLSKPRYERFEGLELDDRLKKADSEPWCGVQVIDLTSGTCKHWFRIDGAISELYDVGVVPKVRCPMAIGFGSPDMNGLITFAEKPAPPPLEASGDDAAPA